MELSSACIIYTYWLIDIILYIKTSYRDIIEFLLATCIIDSGGVLQVQFLK